MSEPVPARAPTTVARRRQIAAHLLAPAVLILTPATAAAADDTSTEWIVHEGFHWDHRTPAGHDHTPTAGEAVGELTGPGGTRAPRPDAAGHAQRNGGRSAAPSSGTGRTVDPGRGPTAAAEHQDRGDDEGPEEADRGDDIVQQDQHEDRAQAGYDVDDVRPREGQQEPAPGADIDGQRTLWQALRDLIERIDPGNDAQQRHPAQERSAAAEDRSPGRDGRDDAEDQQARDQPPKHHDGDLDERPPSSRDDDAADGQRAGGRDELEESPGGEAEEHPGADDRQRRGWSTEPPVPDRPQDLEDQLTDDAPQPQQNTEPAGEAQQQPGTDDTGRQVPALYADDQSTGDEVRDDDGQEQPAGQAQQPRQDRDPADDRSPGAQDPVRDGNGRADGDEQPAGDGQDHHQQQRDVEPAPPARDREPGTDTQGQQGQELERDQQLILDPVPNRVSVPGLEQDQGSADTQEPSDTTARGVPVGSEQLVPGPGTVADVEPGGSGVQQPPAPGQQPGAADPNRERAPAQGPTTGPSAAAGEDRGRQRTDDGENRPERSQEPTPSTRPTTDRSPAADAQERRGGAGDGNRLEDPGPSLNAASEAPQDLADPLPSNQNQPEEDNVVGESHTTSSAAATTGRNLAWLLVLPGLGLLGLAAALILNHRRRS